ncbi:hypothetical protein G6011_08073 [Alternaria panax]|uniref:ABC transporter domain-containing protein n=1 Tax=Alternaria panax TaxID=48097 RepID=A0AAD4FHD4_9PLEO|nr:hypothetical protein G6011_08073 [Alternaria panax]
MNAITALVVGSLFYNLSPNTASFSQRAALIFFTVVMNAIASSLEVLLLYGQRPIVEKHLRYAFYHPSAEAFASILTDIPYKVGNAIFFNVVIFMITGLRREPGAFFFFLFTCFLTTITMSMMFRLLASSTRSLAQALVPTGVMIATMALIDGWVESGAITALMGVSGAGKTTLLNALADRLPSGIVSGDVLFNERVRALSFGRKTGYVQQHDIHLPTDTVREALSFSALLRLPSSMSKQEKLNIVNDTIQVLDMESFADALIGNPGDGLNVEQRRRLSIGVELVAKPELLFLDEPTSGLDSATAWSICSLLEKLRTSGQAILCTIHQPSAPIFAKFDRLILLGSGGKTLYSGDIGHRAAQVIEYFERRSGTTCPKSANPAEWLLKVSATTSGLQSDVDWTKTWYESPEYRSAQERLSASDESRDRDLAQEQGVNDNEYGESQLTQLRIVTGRVFRQYWRSPSYIYSKLALVLGASLLSGFSLFQSARSLQGLSNQLFSIFMLFTIFGQLTQQIMPNFVMQRTLYEGRE